MVLFLNNLSAQSCQPENLDQASSIHVKAGTILIFRGGAFTSVSTDVGFSEFRSAPIAN
jgi:hypothetical protein